MDTEFSAITISIPRVKISHLQKNAYIYQMDIATRWAKWHLQKKYSQFQQLHKYLSKQFNNLPEFPQSMFSTYLGQGQQDAQQYRDILQDYMRITSLRKDIINSQLYSQFLQLQKHSQALLANKPKFQGQFQIQQKSTDDGKIVIDLYYHQNFIVFATGNNSSLQRFNAAIANTKFPWQSDQQVQFVLPLGTIQCWLLKKKPYGYSRIWARNYPVEVSKFLFLPQPSAMIVGLSDGTLQFFRLVPRNNYLYYQHTKTLHVHQDSINGLHLDKINMIIYSSSVDGFLNVFDFMNGALIQSRELHSQITGLFGQSDTNRLFLALNQGNMQIYQYDYKGKLKLLTVLSTPDTSNIKIMLLQTGNGKTYFFAGAYDSGSIYVYQMPKSGQQKFIRQVAIYANKPKIISMHWIPEKMELIATCETGEVFFWDSVKGKQIYMLRPFDQGQIGKTHYIPSQKTLLTAQKGTLIKFWQLPKQWRDTSIQLEQQRQLQIRRKVENLHKTRVAIKKKQQDSDDDDIAYWYLDQTESSQEQQGWFNFDI